MSGPCTLEYLLLQGALLGAKSVLDAARGVREGMADARDAALRDAADRVADARRMHEEARAGMRRLAERARELEAAIERLRSLASTLSATDAGQPSTLDAPARPAALADHALAEYVAALEAALSAQHARLSAVATSMAKDGATQADAERLARLAESRSLDDLLDAWLAGRRDARAEATRAERRERVRRLIAPLATYDEAGRMQPLPADVGALLAALASPEEEQRAQALELELRRVVAAERTKREAKARDAARARELLGEIDAHAADDAATNEMRQTLELVACGLVDLTPAIEARARSLATALAAAEAEALRKVAAQVLEGTLADLGFVVEPIAHTLFVEGGVAHFSRPEWGEYAVRLRASPADGTLNFNVVREAGATQTDAVSARLRDMRAEETWCEHIPRLAETLESRGIRLKVKRRLGAGEAPVQIVPAGALAGVPKPATEAQRRADAPPAAREIP